jgi:hypothetical protein
MKRRECGGTGALLDIDEDQPAAYKELMRLVGEQRRETETESQAFARVFADPSNAALARSALARPDSSSPPRERSAPTQKPQSEIGRADKRKAAEDYRKVQRPSASPMAALIS